MSGSIASLVDTPPQVTRRLGWGFVALAGATYGLVVLGALVRAHGAGLACPDWPLCFGEVIPELDFEVAFEFGHRVVAGSVGLLYLLLAGLTLREPGLRRRMAPALAIAAGLLAVQVVLGGLTVLRLLAVWTVTSHLVTGNAFALALVLIGRRLLRLAARAPAPPPAPRSVRAVVSAGAVLLVLQIVLGGLVASSYAGLVCPEWPACVDGELFPTWRGIRGLHVLHRTVGYAVVVALIGAAVAARSHPGGRHWLAAAAAISLAQVGVGAANVLLRLPVEITGLHSALAAALVCTVGVGTREIWRGTSPG